MANSTAAAETFWQKIAQLNAVTVEVLDVFDRQAKLEREMVDAFKAFLDDGVARWPQMTALERQAHEQEIEEAQKSFAAYDRANRNGLNPGLAAHMQKCLEPQRN